MIDRRDSHGERGAILLVLVVGVAVTMILLGAAAQSWNTLMQREREAEFVSRATQIAHAIRRYQADTQKLPTTMKELTEPGPNGNSRYLRGDGEWKDPLTGENFVLLWLAPDGATLFRSDGKPAKTGGLRATMQAGQQLSGGGMRSNHNQANALNMQAVTVPLGSPSYDGEKVRSLLDTYKKAKEQSVGSRFGRTQAFSSNPELNLGGFDTGSDLLSTPGIGPIVGVATSFTGESFMHFEGHEDYSGFEITVFSLTNEQLGAASTGLAPERNRFEMPGTPVVDPLSPEGMRLNNTDPSLLGGGKSLKEMPGGKRR